MANEVIGLHELPANCSMKKAQISKKQREVVEEMEKKLIFATLKQCGGNKEKTAEVLGVSSKTLCNRLRQYETDDSAL